jgi:hypothetical protein
MALEHHVNLMGGAARRAEVVGLIGLFNSMSTTAERLSPWCGVVFSIVLLVSIGGKSPSQLAIMLQFTHRTDKVGEWRQIRPS